MDNNRDSRSYLSAHWKPAPVRVWALTLGLGLLLAAAALVTLLLIF